MRKRRCAIFCAPLWCACEEQRALPESGGIFYTFFKVHRHFCVFLVYSHFSQPMSLPEAGCRCLNRADGDWYPLTRSSLSPLSRWHRDTKCELSARQADYYYTLLPLLPRQARGVAAPRRLTEERRGERRQDTTRRNTTGEQEESWEEESDVWEGHQWCWSFDFFGLLTFSMYLGSRLRCVKKQITHHKNQHPQHILAKTG